jgi:hypothetical protein
MTSRPYSSMLVMSWSWVRPGMPYFRSNVVAPRARTLAAIFRATVPGEPTNSAPSGPVSQSNLLVVGSATPAQVSGHPGRAGRTW